MEILKNFSISSWQEPLSNSLQTELTNTLESGNVLFFPELAFQPNEHESQVLSPHFINTKSKNISFNLLTNEMRGLHKNTPQEHSALFRCLLTRFAKQAQQFAGHLFPHYSKTLRTGRTSFRPVEISGRVSSYRKDDTRLHVDAFPSNPNQGWRILRVFCNINPNAQPRIWRVGEPFEEVAKQFLPQLRKPIPGSAHLLRWLQITKQYRTHYDHYMLQLHDNMKADEEYQRKAAQQVIQFPAGSTWVVQTDHVSHAAMSGQFVLEQTFYLPVEAMMNPAMSPLRVLEKLMGKRLVW